MAIEKQINIVVKETGLDQVQKQVNKLDASLENLSDTNKGVAKSMVESSNSVLDNGGAMGLLNDATGGLAMTVKDAVEASVLFTKSQKISATWQTIYTTVIGTSTGALKAFRIALAATGIGLIVIGLGLLIANFDKVKKAVLAFIPGLSIVGDIFTKLVQTVTDFVGVTSDASRELDRLGKQADKTLAKNKFALEAYGDTYDEYTKRKIEANSKYAQHVKDINEDETLSEKQKLERLKILRTTANREIDKAEADRIAERNKKAKEAQDKIDEKNKEAADKAKEARKKAAEERAAEEKKIADEKLAADLESAKEAMSIVDELKKNAETPAQKEQREFEEKKAVLEANNVSTLELEAEHKQNISNLNDEYFAAEADKSIKRTEEEKARDEKIKADKLASEQAIQDALVLIAESTASIFDSLEALGLKKSKAAQTIRKGIALAQIAVDTGKAIGSAVELATKAGVAAQTAAPFVPGIGTAATIASYASSAAMIFSNVAKAKQLLNGGGGGGGSTGGFGGGSVPSAPSFNLVQGTNSNQIASSINNQQPIEAFVVSKNVTSGQELDRNIIKSASL